MKMNAMNQDERTKQRLAQILAGMAGEILRVWDGPDDDEYADIFEAFERSQDERAQIAREHLLKLTPLLGGRVITDEWDVVHTRAAWDTFPPEGDFVFDLDDCMVVIPGYGMEPNPDLVDEGWVHLIREEYGFTWDEEIGKVLNEFLIAILAVPKAYDGYGL